MLQAARVMLGGLLEICCQGNCIWYIRGDKLAVECERKLIFPFPMWR